MALHLTGSIDVSGSITSTNITSTHDLTVSGSSEITGSLGVTGSVNFKYSSSLQTSYNAWSVGSPMPRDRNASAGAGDKNSALVFGGQFCQAYFPGVIANTEEYDGFSWSVGGYLSYARENLAGAGSQNAALAIGGEYGDQCGGPSEGYYNVLSCTEEYNGTSWSTQTPLTFNRRCGAAAGTQTSALMFGGAHSTDVPNNNPQTVNYTEEYNGSSWSAGGVLGTARKWLSGTGENNFSALAFGGTTSTPVTCTEKYNGISWSAIDALNSPQTKGAGAGTVNDGLSFGGCPRTTATTEAYDGISWSVNGSLITGRSCLTGAGISSTTAIASNGYGSGAAGDMSSYTEEYNIFNSSVIKGLNFDTTTGDTTATGSFRGSFTGAFKGTANKAHDATSASMANSVAGDNVTGTVPLAASASYLQPISSSVEITGSFKVTGSVSFASSSIDPTILGPAWSTGGNLSTARYALAGAGTQTAGLAFGGNGGSYCTEEYNGASWSSGGSLSDGRYAHAGVGTQTSALAFGGYDTTNYSITNTTIEYNGSSWSDGGNLSTARCKLAGAGTQNAALAFGGYDDNYSKVTCTEEYNGAAWSTAGVGNLSQGNYLLGGAGTQNSAVAFGGDNSGTVSEEYNGSSWSSGGYLNTYRKSLAGAGTSISSVLAFGGYDTDTYNITNATEEYDGTNWSTRPNSITARCSLGGAGTQSSALAFGGYDGSDCVSSTEEYNSSSTVLKRGSKTQFDYSNSTGKTMIIPPTTDPAVVGALWNNGGTLAISAG